MPPDLRGPEPSRGPLLRTSGQVVAE